MPTYETWSSTREPSIPAPHEIHIWSYRLEETLYSPDSLALFEQALSSHEQGRIGRLASAEGKKHYLISHGVMRAILAGYLHITPAALQLQHSPLGKPHLVPGHHRMPLQFNLSHSHGTALLAVASHFEVGVDIERVRPNVAHMKLAARYFSSTELEQLQHHDAAQQQLAFYRCWARKEALVKANGKGIARGLHDFEVPVTTQPITASLRMVTDPASVWRVCDLPSPPGYVAAVAGNTSHAQCSYREWVDSRS